MSQTLNLEGKVWLGKAGKLQIRPLAGTEAEKYDFGFNYISEKLARIDPDVAALFEEKKSFYRDVAEVAKFEFDLAFGGIKPDSNEFGMCVIPPRPFIGSNTWGVSVSSAGWIDVFGSSSSPISGSGTAGQKRMYAFNGLIIYSGPAPVYLRFHINGVDYPVLSVEEVVRVPRRNSYIKYVKLPWPILINTQGQFYMRGCYWETGTSEIAPIGLMYAEYTYMNTEGNWYT